MPGTFSAERVNSCNHNDKNDRLSLYITSEVLYTGVISMMADNEKSA